MQNIKGGGQSALDVRTLSATEVFASDDHLGIDEAYNSDPADRQFGLPFNIMDMPENKEDTQGNTGWNNCDPGPGIVESRMVAGSKDPQPGGGF
jgi:hypothetical protein